jgi:hypothetical protein
MIVDVMCHIAGGPPRPAQLTIEHTEIGLVSWSVTARDIPQSWQPEGDELPIELHLPDETVWIGEAYPVGVVELEQPEAEQPAEPLTKVVQLRGTGPLRENSIPVHADVVIQRVEALVPEDENSAAQRSE